MDDSVLDRLPIDWAAWTLENVIRGVSYEDIRTVLADAGYSGIANELGKGDGASSLDAAKKAVRCLTSYRDILTRRLKLRSLKAPTIQRQRCDPEAFYENCYFANEPVILTDLVPNDSSLRNWSPTYFENAFGDVEVEVQSGREKDANYEINLDAHRARMSLRDFVGLVNQAGSTNDIYMCANNRTLDTDLARLFDEVPAMPGLLEDAKARNQCFLWFGPKGTITPFHYDVLNVLLYQVYGAKRFVIAPPEATPFMYNDIGVFSRVDYFGDHTALPLFREVPIIVGTLDPGEALFIPVGWWHTILAESTSISLSFTNFSKNNDFRKVSC